MEALHSDCARGVAGVEAGSRTFSGAEKLKKCYDCLLTGTEHARIYIVNTLHGRMTYTQILFNGV